VSFLADKVHVAIVEFDAVITVGPTGVPSDKHVVVGGDVELIESAVRTRVENWSLGVGRDLVNENLGIVTGENEMIAVLGNVGFTFAADLGVFGERVDDRTRHRSDVE